MNEKQIRLRSREEVQDFVQAASNCNFDIDISYDRVIIDAKYFLGVLGLGVSRVLTVTYCGKDMDFENTVQKYAVAQLTAQKKVCIEQVIYDGRKGSVDISIEMFADPFCMHYNERRQ